VDDASAPAPGTRLAGDWTTTELGRAVDRARQGGLEVGVTGDLGAVVRLTPAVCRALGLAVAQCLTNVAVHSGTDRAEVVIYGDGVDLTVMIIDDGIGFDAAATRPDRLGIKNSVEARMTRVGGSAQIWSSPGSGTSVMLRVPVADTLPSPSSTVPVPVTAAPPVPGPVPGPAVADGAAP
jgi:signal transduction histidine kinase